MSVTVCTMAHGPALYKQAASQTIKSVLCHTTFNIFNCCDDNIGLKNDSRVTCCPIKPMEKGFQRPDRFLRKFEVLTFCLQQCPSDWIIWLDADAVFVRQLSEKRLRQVMGDAPIGMVEQTTVTGSTMGRADFFKHYREHSLVVIGRAANAISPKTAFSSFRYFNSGVVVARRQEWKIFLDWARSEVFENSGKHEVGKHMVADQDYFQYWVNTLHPGRCRSLPWHWNHCEYWDNRFPKPGALIVHFSNFCNGPTVKTIKQMREFSSRVTIKNRCIGWYLDRNSSPKNP